MPLFASLIAMLVLLLLSDLQGRQYILQVLEEAVLRSKERIRGGAEPSCLLDFWTQQILTECQVRGLLFDTPVKTLCRCPAAGLVDAADPQCVTASEVRACKCTTRE
jgi:hypothetical protein